MISRRAGIAFDRVVEPIDDVLPRMDVALFVGFAASGPINIPVAVEQVTDYEAIFGGDVAIGFDSERGSVVVAHLAPAVRAFFRNGGQRCWVLRVAGADAAAGVFPLAGLVSRAGDGGALSPATAVARSKGSWSDAVEIGTVVDRSPVVVTAVVAAARALLVDVAGARSLVIGDVLRLWFRGAGALAFGAVRVIDSTRNPVRLTLDPVIWFREPDHAPTGGGTAVFLGVDGKLATRAATVASTAWQPRTPLDVDIAVTADDPVATGSVIQLTLDRSLLMAVTSETVSDPASTAMRVSGLIVEPLASPPAMEWPTPDAADRLTLTLLARAPGQPSQQLDGLGLSSTHPSFWADLQPDDLFYSPLADPSADAVQPTTPTGTVPRFPTVGSAQPVSMTVPIGDVLVADFLGPLPSTTPAMVRDGLVRFSSAVFFDSELKDSNTNDLIARGEFIRYQSGAPRPLAGIHAAMFLDEPTIIAVPDAIHRAWRLEDETHAGVFSLPLLPADPLPLDPCSPPTLFRDCSRCVLAPQTLSASETNGRIRLVWSSAENAAGDQFTVQEAVGPDFPSWDEVWTGTRRAFELYDRPAGTYAFRVIARRGTLVSPPSDAEFVTLLPRQRAVIVSAADYDAAPLFDIHRALLRFAAARGDLVAVLGLPLHYREAEAIAHAQALTPGTDGSLSNVSPLRYGEEPALSYGALFHPWVALTNPDVLTPPDGVVCGVIGRKTLERGAWIAPANASFDGVVALAPSLAESRRLDLQIGRVNVVQQEPRGFLTLSADTLSTDADLRLLHVRRLLILLRKHALAVGAQYVFEPNDDGFRRLVQRGFEEMLGSLHERGAFAGRLATNAYQVVTSAALNTPQQQDLGRFFVELRVAPAQPMAFLTVRLLQRGDRLTASEGR